MSFTNFESVASVHGSPRGVVLLAHGLNFKPERMNSLAHILQQNGFAGVTLCLSGHEGNLQKFKTVTADLWEREFFEAYSHARDLARRISKPLHFVGYSLGAALGLALMGRSHDSVSFEKMALFAPAIAIRPSRHLVRAFNIWGPKFCLPSANLESYRANPGTSMAAYNALFGISRKANRQGFAKSNISTLVFIDPLDELVSLKGLEKIIQAHGLDRWILRKIKKTGTFGAQRIHHLLTDEESLGHSLWIEIQNNLVTHLKDS